MAQNLNAQKLRFYGWQRSGVYALSDGTVTPEEGRLQASIQITLQDREDPNDSVTGLVDFLIAGPRDVEGLLPGAITARMPPPNSTNAETTKCVYVEFGAPDLPWRYTPETTTDQALRPWIVLVVGKPEDVQLGPNNRVSLSTEVMDAHDLTHSARWAHVQEEVQEDDGGRVISRLLSPRELPEDSELVAAIVPAFDEAGNPSWRTGDTGKTLPYYHAWRFRTGEAGDFKTLATRLRPGEADSDLGRARLNYRRTETAVTLHVRGALAPPGEQDVSVAQEVRDDLEQLFELEPDERGRPLVGLPRYGEPWVTDPTTTQWGVDANSDPRHRGVAGLGLWAGIELQQEIVDAAAAQVGALDAAEQRIRNLTMGLGAVRSLWKRRLPRNPRQRLLLFGPSLRRMVTARGTVLDAISGPGRPLPPRLFSSAARRVLRYGPARTARADRQATSPAAILERANTPPPPPDRVMDGLPHVDGATNVLGQPNLDELVQQGPDAWKLIDTFLNKVEQSPFSDTLEDIRKLVEETKDPQDLPVARLVEILAALPTGDEDELGRLAARVIELMASGQEQDYDSLVELGEGLINEPPERPCEAVNLGDLDQRLTEVIDPTGDEVVTIRGVGESIEGLDRDQLLAPVEVCIGLDYPVWTFLRDRAPDWLLPGVSGLEEDAVVALESNPTFVDAFLLGLNTQVLGELRWRNLRIATGCTPMRTFWDKIDPDGEGHVPDIRGIDVWSPESELGDESHQEPPRTAGGDLVLVFRSDLFRRYPNTLLYVAPAPLDANNNPEWGAETPFNDQDRLFPTFQGSIGDDITFFRFEIEATAARECWIVLEEPPSGYAFYNRGHYRMIGSLGEIDPSVVTDGANFADVTFCNPVRVLIRGNSLFPEGV